MLFQRLRSRCREKLKSSILGVCKLIFKAIASTLASRSSIGFGIPPLEKVSPKITVITLHAPAIIACTSKFSGDDLSCRKVLPSKPRYFEQPGSPEGIEDIEKSIFMLDWFDNSQEST